MVLPPFSKSVHYWEETNFSIHPWIILSYPLKIHLFFFIEIVAQKTHPVLGILLHSVWNHTTAWCFPSPQQLWEGVRVSWLQNGRQELLLLQQECDVHLGELQHHRCGYQLDGKHIFQSRWHRCRLHRWGESGKSLAWQPWHNSLREFLFFDRTALVLFCVLWKIIAVISGLLLLQTLQQNSSLWTIAVAVTFLSYRLTINFGK